MELFGWIFLIIFACEIGLFWRICVVMLKRMEKIERLEETPEGQMFKGNIPGQEIKAFSIGDGPMKTEVPPKPEWETKTTWFDIDHDDMLSMRMEDWNLFVQKVQKTWINMLRNDGYKIGDTLETQVMDSGGLLFGMKKVELRVKVHKEEKVEKPDWVDKQPPENRRWVTPVECHGNSAFCSTCSPRNPDRPHVDHTWEKS